MKHFLLLFTFLLSLIHSQNSLAEVDCSYDLNDSVAMEAIEQKLSEILKDKNPLNKIEMVSKCIDTDSRPKENQLLVDVVMSLDTDSGDYLEDRCDMDLKKVGDMWLPQSIVCEKSFETELTMKYQSYEFRGHLAQVDEVSGKITKGNPCSINVIIDLQTEKIMATSSFTGDSIRVLKVRDLGPTTYFSDRKVIAEPPFLFAILDNTHNMIQQFGTKTYTEGGGTKTVLICQ